MPSASSANCIHCGQLNRFTAEQRGQTLACRACGRVVILAADPAPIAEPELPSIATPSSHRAFNFSTSNSPRTATMPNRLGMTLVGLIAVVALVVVALQTALLVQQQVQHPLTGLLGSLRVGQRIMVVAVDNQYELVVADKYPTSVMETVLQVEPTYLVVKDDFTKCEHRIPLSSIKAVHHIRNSRGFTYPFPIHVDFPASRQRD
jgi:hypothetical protein